MQREILVGIVLPTYAVKEFMAECHAAKCSCCARLDLVRILQFLADAQKHWEVLTINLTVD